jgi:dolichyl-phosphate-mannose--protein O-mannosyl transferase
MVILATFSAFFLSVFFAFIREYAEKMPQEDKARWREIMDMSGLRRIGSWVGSKWTALFTRAGRNGRG